MIKLVKEKKTNTHEELWKSYKSNPTVEKRNELAEIYLPMVKARAKKLHKTLPRSTILEDLEQEGFLGLLDAIDRYKPETEVLFESYAPRRINGEMLDSIRREDWVPRVMREREKMIALVKSNLNNNGEIPSRQKIKEALGKTYENLTEREIDLTLKDSEPLKFYSLDQPIGNISSGSKDKKMYNKYILADKRSTSDPARVVEQKNTLKKLTAGLTRAEKMIINALYFGGLTMSEIGKTIGISESRVSQMHTSIIGRLKSKEGLEELLVA